MRIAAIVGFSETGKTRLVARLIMELRRRGVRVAAVKRCAHGFSLDTEGKDSSDFTSAGAEGVALVSPEGWAAFGGASGADAPSLAARLFPESGVVLIEGGKDVRGVPKIEVLRAGVSEIPVSPPDELVALVSDLAEGGPAAVPVFGPDDTAGIADFILTLEEARMADITLEVDGREVNLNAFVRTIFERTILALITSLSGVDPDPRRISIVIDRAPDKSPGGPRP